VIQRSASLTARDCDPATRYDACVRKRLAVVALVVAIPLFACGAVLGSSDDVEPPPRRDDPEKGGPILSGADAADEASLTTDGATDQDAKGDATSDGALVGKDAAVDADAGRTTKYVFVTSERYAGGFATRADADALCTFLAKQGNSALFSASTFKAYLAAGNGAAAAVRIVDRAYVRMDGKTVFDPGPQTNATPSDLVVLDEKGNNLSLDGNKFVWTGHANNVAAADRTCMDWASNAGTKFGGFGDMHTTATWGTSTGATAGCDSLYRLYCFED
jgi:hypothetical protein